jgi:hypothetical protein
VRSSQGECYELSLSDNDLSKLTAIINGFVCGLDDGNGNLWLGSKDAGLLQLTHTPVR